MEGEGKRRKERRGKEWKRREGRGKEARGEEALLESTAGEEVGGCMAFTEDHEVNDMFVEFPIGNQNALYHQSSVNLQVLGTDTCSVEPCIRMRRKKNRSCA